MTLRIAAVLLVLAAAFVSPLSGQEADAPARDAKVLIVLADGFNVPEFWYPYLSLQGMGYRVDVASPEKRTIRPGNKPGPHDVAADLTLDAVDPEQYVGLVIPGGRSPEKLETHARAVEIARWFMTNDRPVAAICHGPRLLAQAGVLDDRVATCLFQIAEELPEIWTSERFATYVDREVVVDGNLVTSRWPEDLVPFIEAMLEKLADNGGIALPETRPDALVIDGGGDAHLTWAMTVGLRAQKIAVRHVRVEKPGQSFSELNPREYDVLAIVEGDGLDRLETNAEFVRLVEQFGSVREGGPRILAVGDANALLTAVAGKIDMPAVSNKGILAGIGESIVDCYGDAGLQLQTAASVAHARAAEAGKTADQADEPAERHTAVIALHPQFDDRVYAAMEAALQARGHRVALLGAGDEWVKGLAGIPARPDGTYDELPKLVDHPLIVAPGGHWPKSDASASRTDWLVERYQAGDTLITFGMDSLRVATAGDTFAGKSFASTAQAAWFFRPARYSDQPVVETTDRLLSASGAEALGEVLRRLDAERFAPPGE